MVSLRRKKTGRRCQHGRRKIDNFKTLGKAVVETFYEYTEATEVNGLWMLRRNKMDGVFRWIWVSILFILFILGVYLTAKLWLKFYSVPTLTTIATNIPITDIAFPGITLCNPQTIIDRKASQFIAKINISGDYTEEELIAGLLYLDAFTTRQWQAPNTTLLQAVDDTLELNNITVTEAVMEVSAGCKDFLQHCFWGTTEFPCQQQNEDLSFSPSISQWGLCCSFNYNPNNQSYVPFSSNLFGVNGGLNIIGVEGSGSNIATGLLLLVHHPMDFASESASSVTLKPNSESFVEVYPTDQSSSKDVLELKREKRNCLIPADVDLAIYRQAACQLACQTDVIYNTCDCHPYHLPVFNKDVKRRNCKLSDAICYTDNYDYFKSVKCEHCLPNCYDITYTTTSFFTDLKQHEYSVSNIHTMYNFTNDNFILRVYLAKQVVPTSRKIIVMSWMSLLSDLGGVFSLCLGISIISLVEFFYFFTFRLYRNYLSQRAIIQMSVTQNLK